MEGYFTVLGRRVGIAPVPAMSESMRAAIIRLARPMLLVSFAALAMAPLLAGDSYSLVEQTVSEAGGQGMDGAWLFRAGVIATSVTVFAFSFAASPYWPHTGRLGIRLYSVFLLGVAAFSDLPWNDFSGNETEAFVHTFSVFWSGFWFVIGVAGISVARPADTSPWTRLFDRVIIPAVILIPMMMMLIPADGLLQRLLITMGYGWLLMEVTLVLRRSDEFASALVGQDPVGRSKME